MSSRTVEDLKTNKNLLKYYILAFFCSNPCLIFFNLSFLGQTFDLYKSLRYLHVKRKDEKLSFSGHV